MDILRSHWNNVKTNWLIRISQRFIFLLFLLSLGMLLWKLAGLPPKVPLWYSRPWGEDQLAHPFWLFLLPISTLVWYGINFLVAMYMLSEYLLFTQMLFVSSLVVSLLSFLTLIKILFLVT